MRPWLALLALLAACPKPAPPPAPPTASALPAAPFVTFTDSLTAADLAVDAASLWWATEGGLVQVSRRTGQLQEIPGPGGAALSQVAAQGEEVWAASGSALYRYQEGWSPGIEIPAPLDLALYEGALWLASEEGLYRVREGGLRRVSALRARALWVGARGLLVATAEGLWVQRGGELLPAPGWSGLALRGVGEGGGLLLGLSDDPQGRPRVLRFGPAEGPVQERSLPEDAQLVGGALVVGRRVLGLSPSQPGEVMGLGASGQGWRERGRLERAPSALAFDGESAFAAVPSRGAWSFGAEEAHYGLNDLLPRGGRAFLGSTVGGEVLVPTRGPYVARLTGEDRWTRVPVAEGKEARVLGVAASPSGEIEVIVQARPGGPLLVKRWDGVGLSLRGSLRLGGLPRLPELSFFEISPEGELWLGLREERGLAAGLGWASADLSQSERLRQGQAGKAGALKGILLPSDAVAQVRFVRGATWIATNGGLVWRRGGSVRIFEENEALDSEIVHDVAVDRLDLVWLATGDGVGVLQQGARWNFDRYRDVLGEHRTRALLATEDGSMWVGTDEGVFVLGPSKRSPEGEWRHLRPEDGLCGAEVADLAADARGRVWYLTESGFCVSWRGPQ